MTLPSEWGRTLCAWQVVCHWCQPGGGMQVGGFHRAMGQQPLLGRSGGTKGEELPLSCNGTAAAAAVAAYFCTSTSARAHTHMYMRTCKCTCICA